MRKCLSWGAVLAWFASGWAASVTHGRQPVGALEEKPLPPVVSIEVTGEPAWQRGEIEGLVQPLVAQGWADDLASEIRTAIMATGLYREAIIGKTPADNGIRLHIEVSRKPLVERVTFRGYRLLSLRQIERAARLPLATLVDEAILRAVEERVRTLYSREGFPAATVRAEAVATVPGAAEVIVWIHEGMPRIVDTIEWLGFEPPKPREFLRALPVHPGQRWTQTRAKDTQRAAVRYLRKLGYFEARVEVEFEDSSGRAPGRLRFKIRPGPRCNVVFAGNRKISSEYVFQEMRLWDRSLVSDGTWRQMRRTLAKLYQERGYYLVRVDLDIARPGVGQKEILFRVQEGPKLRIRRVSCEGCQRARWKKLEEVMETGPTSWFPRRDGFLVQSRFEEDLRRLWFRFRELGFVDAEITDYRIEVDEKQGVIDVTVVVEEGLPVVVGDIDFAGLPSPAPEFELRQVRRGRPLDPFAVERAAESLAQVLRDDGYSSPSVDGKWEITERRPDARVARVTFEVHPGLRLVLGRLQIVGSAQLDPSVIRRESRLRPGDPLTFQSLAGAQQRLYQLGLFRSVELDLIPGEDSTGGSGGGTVPRDVAIRVQERAPIGFTFGGGYNTRDGFRAFGELAHINVAHRGERLSIRGDIALDPAQATTPNEYLMDVGFRDPQLWGTRWALRWNAVAQRATRSVDQFSIERLALVPAVETRWSPALLTGVELQFETARIFDLRPDARAFNPADEGSLDTGSVGPFLVYEGRDDPFMPRRGVFDSVRLRLAPGFLGSDEPLAKLQWHHSQYVPLNDSLTWLYAFRGGWARTFSGDVVPIRERFFLGGRSTVRGFSENSIGPLGAPIVDPLGNRIFPGGNPLGGDLAINVNTEIRFPLVWGALGAAFVDGGGVYLVDRGVSLDDFRRSAGVGLMYQTPVGPLALHYGIKLDRRSGEAFGAVHFTIGTLF